MKTINLFLTLLIVGCVTFLNAQKGAEEIITESSEPAEDRYVDDIVSKRLVVENTVLPYEPIREADIAWQKKVWRVLDTREKMNLPFRYPEKPLFNVFREMIENGDITVFEDEKFTTALTPEEVEKSLNRVDTSVIFDYDTYEEKVQVVKSEISWEDINRFRVKEIWFFDEESSRLRVRILGIAPERDVYDDETQEFKYSLPLFWIYYPEARNLLSKHRIFNENNDMAPMTWAALFESRFFSSVIYKSSNVLDLRVKDMFDASKENSNIDILLESKKIKAELFNFEHDFWTY
ncbi:MAG TPA: gliding motility protein GldN [Saprospirales bacterium]|jgi:gliding motility associated protien GldN|uniref:Gliding motility associated protein GldN n=1 Tax=uncultured Flavobacteriia bacterium TaxID=212695 RepID=H6RDZ9_9BACT|nr:gliding motility protein GldN [uncultured bacterium]MBT3543897.1 gliding motility protein GldN [Saprospiraceae bacterium]CCF99260.1 gliding motility associated protein GldN [uncultured Flavobacteriia bacterium]HAW06034.1 gliding motility protein GldN [Saprospirales bacterium]